MSWPRPESPRLADLRFAGAALAALLLCACLLDTRRAGTSTTVGNTLTGVAVLSGGGPAAGAEVSLRSGEVRVARGGVPTSRLVAFATADSLGAFALPASSDTGLFLEIRQASDSRPPGETDSLETAFLRISASGGADLGDVGLRVPGSLAGVLLTPGSSDSARWIGAQGTDDFARAAADGSFRIDGLAPGPHALIVVSVPQTGVSAQSLPMVFHVALPKPSDPEVKSGEVTDMGGIFYSPPPALQPRVGI